jgi:DNA polymerase elongation subunit (family B)
MTDFPRPDEPPPLEGALEFQVVDWFIPENDKSKQRREQEERRINGGWVRPEVPTAPAQYEIFMFGTTENGATVTAKVTGFQPYFYIKVPNSWTLREKASLQELLFQEVPMKTYGGAIYNAPPIRKSLQKHFVKMKLVERKDFWGFTNGADFKFIQIFVKSLRLFNDLKRFFGGAPPPGLLKLKDMAEFMQSRTTILYESNIDPFLRFIHERGIQPCGWVHIPEDAYSLIDPDQEQQDRNEQYEKAQEAVANDTYKEWIVDETPCISRTNYCVVVAHEDVYGLSYNKIAPLLVASFDIECTSSHGDFPVAIKDYRKLTVDLIAVTRYAAQHGQTFKDHINDWIVSAYKQDVVPFPESVSAPIVHRLYAAAGGDTSEAHIRARLEKHGSRVYDIISAVLKAKGRKREADDAGDGEEGGDDSDAEEPSGGGKMTSAQMSALENELTNMFTTSLPKLKGDPIIQIGTTVHRYGSDEIIFRHITTLKSCTDIPDALVEPCNNEVDVLRNWKMMIQQLDPDILTGYNIFGFDMKYIADRARELDMYDELVEGLGRLRNRKSDIEERKLSSSALGDNIMYCFDLDGIVQIDMLKVMQRDHKLDSYKLDSVAGIFIVDSGIVTTPTQLQLKNSANLREGNFIKIAGTKKQVMHIETDSHVITLDSELPPETKIGEKITWGLVKDDISPNQIFAKQKGSADDRALIAKYCLQDCALVNKLLHKLKVLENNIGMGNVCYVPLSYLFMRGQGVKIFSLVARECRLKKHLIPLVKTARDVINDDDTVGYEGAIVLPPQEGMYLDDPITVLDYSSLYPSSMIARNISHDALVIDPAYKEAAERENNGITFHDVVFDEYEGIGDKKRVKGQKTCTFAQFPNGEKGIIPSILQMLLTQRKNTRKKIEYQTLTLAPTYASGSASGSSAHEVIGLVSEADDQTYSVLDVDSGVKKLIAKSDVASMRDTYNEFEKAVLDARQLAYKVTANSLYGQTGSRTSQIYLLEIAACTTATGREMIMLAKGFVEREYDGKVIYGDSVTGYTPVIIRHNDAIKIETIENLAEKYGNSDWRVCQEEGRQDKESCEINGVESWTDAGWTKLERVIRHALADSKKIIRINTHHGIVDVTDDHSLLTLTGEKISPKDLHVGSEILHHSCPTVENIVSKYTVEEARIMGFFMGDGSCGDYDCKSGHKCSFALNNANYQMLEMYLELCTKTYPELNWKILDTIQSSGVYKLVPTSIEYGSITKLVRKFREMMYSDKAKIVPFEILNASLDVRQSFWQGLYDADGDKEGVVTRIDQKNQISMATISFLAQSLGYNMSFNTRKDKPNIYRLNLTQSTQRKPAITQMYPVDYYGYVYDLTTINHHFQAGVGNIIAHNTDSIFIKFHNDGKKGREALPLAIASGQRAAKEIKPYLPPPQSLEYEKTLWPFILFSKKRYVGNLYEDDHLKKPKQKSMGIVLKRRDNAPIVKVIYGGIIDILMKGGTLQESVTFLQKSLSDLVEGKVPLEQLILSKTLKSDYKDPSKIAHKVLADRIGERDPGNKPMVNDRIPFVYIKAPGAALQGDRIEHPDYIRAHQLAPDYQFYITNQLMKPITQLYALCVTQLPGYSLVPNYWEQMDVELEGTPMYANDKKRKTRIGNVKMKEVKELLFDPYIVTPKKSPRVGEGSSRKKKEAVAARAFDELVANKDTYYKLNIAAAVEKKRGKIYTCTVTLHECSKSEGLELSREAWTHTADYNGKKVDCQRMASMAAITRFANENEGEESRGTPMLITCEDKVFVRTWKNALSRKNDEKFQEAQKHTDLEMLEEQNEEARFSGLVYARSWLNYVIV